MSYRAYIPPPLTIFFLSFTFPLALDLLQQLIDALAFLFNPVAHEMNFGRARKIQRESELFSHVRRGVLQSFECCFLLCFVSCHGDVDARGSFVSRKSNFSNRDHCQSRVFQCVADNLSNLLLDRICRSFRPTHFRTCALDASLECAELSAPGPKRRQAGALQEGILTAPWPRLAPRHTPQSGLRFLRR